MRIQYVTGYHGDVRKRGWLTTLFLTEELGPEVDRVTRAECWNLWKLLLRIRRFRADVIYVGDLLGIPVGIWNRLGLLSAPAVYFWNEYHEDLHRWYLPFRWMRRLLQWFIVGCFDHVWSNCMYNANRARARGKRVRYIFNGYHAEEEPTAVRLPEGVFNVVYLGDQVGARKNLGMLFDAVRGEPCVLTMIGRTNEALRAIAPENVRFQEPVRPEELYGVLRQADLLVNPSDEDGNVKTSDYIHAGRPILVWRGRRGCQENVFLHRHNAYIAVDLKKGLRALMGDAELRRRLARNVACYPILNWHENTRLRMEYFQEVIEEYARRGGKGSRDAHTGRAASPGAPWGGQEGDGRPPASARQGYRGGANG